MVVEARTKTSTSLTCVLNVAERTGDDIYNIFGVTVYMVSDGE